MNRKGFIGGSDCVAIMQGRWLELWNIKTGREEPEDLSNIIAVQLGIHTEDFNLAWFEKQNKVILSGHQTEFKANVGGIPVVGTVDAMLNRNIVEAKHTNSFNNMDKITKYYMPQLQLYMHIADVDGAYLSVIFGNSDWESVHVARDEDYFNSMWAVVADFWGYVERDEEPIGFNIPILKAHSVPVNEMVVRDATYDNAFVDAAVTYNNLWHSAQQFKNVEKDIKAMVADNEREVFCDYLTIKRDKRGALRIKRRTHDAKK